MIIPCMTICVMIMIMVTAGISSNFYHVTHMNESRHTHNADASSYHNHNDNDNSHTRNSYINFDTANSQGRAIILFELRIALLLFLISFFFLHITARRGENFNSFFYCDYYDTVRIIIIMVFCFQSSSLICIQTPF